MHTNKEEWKSEAIDQVIYAQIWYCIKIPLGPKLAMLPVINDQIFGIAFPLLDVQNQCTGPLVRMELGV